MGIVQAIVYGIIQGLTEFLPVSSTAHLRIAPSLLGWQDPGAAFTAVIQLGTLLAVLIYFRNDLLSILSGWIRSLTRPDARNTMEAKAGWGIFWGTLPIIVLGFLFKHQISGSLRSLYVVATMLIIMGIVLYLAERMSRGRRPFESLTVRDGIIVGLWQAVALIPGASRSGSTISGGLFSGFDRAAAARYSFLLSVPSVLAAGLYEVYSERHSLMAAGSTNTIVATVVSFLVGYACIGWLMGILKKRGTMPFVIYRVLLGIILLGLLSGGVLKPDAGLPPEPGHPGHVPA